MTIVRKQDLKAIVEPRPSGSFTYHARSIMQHMTDKQLQVIERDMLFVKEPVIDPNAHYRINKPNAFGNYEHIVERRQKFGRPNTGDQLVFNEANPIYRDNLLKRDNKYVIPMRLLHSFYAISSKISTNLVINFNLEQDVKNLLKLFPGLAKKMKEIEWIETLHNYRQFFSKHQKLITISTPTHRKSRVSSIWL